MKRGTKLLWAAVLVMLLTSCVDHNEDDTLTLPEVNAPKHIYGSFEKIGTRTTTKDERLILWNDGDEISFFARSRSNLQYRLQKTSSSQNDYGTFQRITTHAEEGEKLNYNYAVYPYAEGIEVLTDGTISLLLPATQYYAKNSFGPGAATAVAVSDGRDGGMMQFKSAVGFLKLPMYGSDMVIKRIELRGNCGEKIAGAATISVPYTAAPGVSMDAAATDVITLDCGEGVRVGESMETATPFWFALPQVFFTDGFTVTIYDDSGNHYKRSTSKMMAVDRNFVQPMMALDVRNDKELNVGVEEGKIILHIEERKDGVRSLSGLGARDWSTSKVLLNGKEYAIYIDTSSNPYIYADISESGVYDAVLLANDSSQWFGTTPYEGVMLPYSQFENRSIETIKRFPMYCSQTKSDGLTLNFNDGFALVCVRLHGMANITSLRLEADGRYDLAGKIAKVPKSGEYKVERGMGFVTLNSTNGGEFAPLYGSKSREFYMMIAPGDYTDGLRLTVCDSEHYARHFEIEDINVKAGDVYTFNAAYTKHDGQIFYEGFDNCVWGGDVVRGEDGYGFAPDASEVGIDSNLDRTGYEESLTEVPYSVEGSAFIQSNTWSDVSGYIVDTSHQTTDSYITSRHFADTRYLFRAQEHPGYIAIGTANKNRGIYNTPIIRNLNGLGSFKAKIRFAMQPGFNGTLLVQLCNGGRMVSAKLDGETISQTADDFDYQGVISTLRVERSQLSIAKDMKEAKKWHTLEVDVVDAANGSSIYIADESTDAGVHGIYIDSVEAWQTGSWEKKPSTLRVILWNIQNGMWADQHNNYDNFVEWVKKWDADVCIWCESETIYKDKTNSTASSKYLPDGWTELCKRYGHSYAAVGGNRDNYPQTVTSKYEIKRVQEITNSNVSGKPISHGAGHFTITVNGKKVNIVTLHMWPQQYGYGVATANREESAAKFEGDHYRAFEMQYIVDKTVNNTKYKSEELWLFGGDTNARSRLDNWYYNYENNSTKLLTHDILLNQTNMKDVIGHRYPGMFMSSTMGNARIDIMYASPAMYDKMDNAITLIDAWLAETAKSKYYSSFYDRSDHRPLIMDFDMSK